MNTSFVSCADTLKSIVLIPKLRTAPKRSSPAGTCKTPAGDCGDSVISDFSLPHPGRKWLILSKTPNLCPGFYIPETHTPIMVSDKHCVFAASKYNVDNKCVWCSK